MAPTQFVGPSAHVPRAQQQCSPFCSTRQAPSVRPAYRPPDPSHAPPLQRPNPLRPALGFTRFLRAGQRLDAGLAVRVHGHAGQGVVSRAERAAAFQAGAHCGQEWDRQHCCREWDRQHQFRNGIGSIVVRNGIGSICLGMGSAALWSGMG